MFIVISGATGFVGRSLCQYLHGKGHTLGVITRTPEMAETRIGVSVEAHERAEAFADSHVDAIINLAGAPVLEKRWSTRRKQELIASRVDITRSLVGLCSRLKQPPKVMVSASAMGYYGDQRDREVDEKTYPRREFAHQLCAEWEAASQGVSALRVRLAIARLGLVMDPSGGMLKSMIPVVRCGAGARLGEGRQYIPWVALEDVVKALAWLVENPDASGAYNVSAPHPVRNAEFMRALGRVTHRPIWLKVPSSILRLGLGERAQMLLTGADMRPRRLLEEGFSFTYSHLDRALNAMWAKAK